ncbi:hypothetical protein MchiMG62_14000 [Methanoculleus chikugoensis]|uniref:Uncharacterized protein n=1 Tax=Methanoculleus chikugoensis TaxID=118126 RepID=A0ABN5XHL7_9EURY|nr:hypothetical protein MchiMG62_14000 [Methanoculleus chikugoensis]
MVSPASCSLIYRRSLKDRHRTVYSRLHPPRPEPPGYRDTPAVAGSLVPVIVAGLWPESNSLPKGEDPDVRSPENVRLPHRANTTAGAFNAGTPSLPQGPG